jgi:diacylglycerol kinase (ATP)
MNSAALGHLDHPARAFDAAAGGATRAIGLLRVRCSGLDGQPVARFGYLIVSLGAAATISHRTSQSRWLKKLGEIAYLLMMPPVTLGYRHRDVAITIDGVAHGTRRLFTAMVANTENGGGGMKLMPGAKPDDGILDLIEMGDVSRPWSISTARRWAACRSRSRCCRALFWSVRRRKAELLFCRPAAQH